MVLDRLKTETLDLHQRLERHPRMQRLLSPAPDREAYRALLGRMLGFYEPLEARMARPLEEAGFAFDERRKAGLLVRDLVALGAARDEVAALPRCAALPAVDRLPEALGCLYVLEGATLGGTVIARHLGRTLGVDAASGAAFYAAYGPRSGPMWRACRRFITACAESDQAAPPLIVASARSTFLALEAWLST